MDPDANLAEQRRLAAGLIDALDAEDTATMSDVAIQALRLAELVQALDEWMTGGGMRPRGWTAERRR